MAKYKYTGQVFINCPFDDKYIKLFRALVFTILDCGFVPRCSLEIDDATVFRLHGIVKLIEQCKYGIHDLSRVQLHSKSKLPRFNMPFELGIFYGAKTFGKRNQSKKTCIVLEKERYRYQKFISDLSGIDIAPHNNSIKKIIIAVRNWLVTSSRRTTIPDSNSIYSRYQKFQRAFKTACTYNGIDINAVPFVELAKNMTDWLKINQEVHIPLFRKAPWNNLVFKTGPLCLFYTRYSKKQDCSKYWG